MIMPLGAIAIPTSLPGKFALNLEVSSIAVSNTATTYALEVDYVAMHVADDDITEATKLGAHSATAAWRIKFEHKQDSEDAPLVYAESTGAVFEPILWSGESLHRNRNSTAGTLLFGIGEKSTGEPTTITSFYLPWGGQGTAANITLTADRTLGFLTPQ